MGTLIFETAWGWCGVAANERAVTRLLLPQPERSVVCEQMGDGAAACDPVAEAAAQQIQEYLRGQRPSSTVALDLGSVSEFTRGTLDACRMIPWGSTLSYQQLAAKVGQPTAARAVGQALAANPIPLLIPCHRVIRADGHLGGFGGGQAMKRRLLELEGAWGR